MNPHIIKLTPGAEKAGPISTEEIRKRKMKLRATVEHYLPEFAEAVRRIHKGEGDMAMMHQDSFAADFDTDEYILLGMGCKYAGLYGVSVHITGDAK